MDPRVSLKELSFVGLSFLNSSSTFNVPEKVGSESSVGRSESEIREQLRQCSDGFKYSISVSGVETCLHGFLNLGTKF